MLKNCRLTVKDLTDMIGILEGSVKSILKDHLGLRKSNLVWPENAQFLGKMSSRWCVWNNAFWLSGAQMRHYGRWNLDLCLRPWNNGSICEYRAKGDARPKRAHQSRSKIKVMMTVFSIFMLWCTMNSFQLAKLLIRYIIEALSVCVTWSNSSKKTRMMGHQLLVFASR